MKLWISGEVDAAVGDGFRETMNAIEPTINQLLATANYQNEQLLCWDCIAIIRDDAVFEPRVRYSAKTKETDFRLPIDHARFRNSSKAERIVLMLNMLRNSLDILSQKYKIKGLAPVYEYIDKAEAELISKHPSHS